MENFPEPIETAARSFAEEERRSASGHPAVEELVAYHAGELAGKAREAVREHLATCGECTRLLLDLMSFPELEPPSEADRLSEAEVTADKEALKARLGEECLRQPLAAEVVAFKRPAKASIPAGYWSALAAVLVMAIGLGLWGWIESAPGADTEVFYPQTEILRESAEESFRIPDWADYYLLVLTSIQADRYPAFRVEIVDAQNRQILSDDSLCKSDDGTFKLRLRRERLPEGPYKIRLFGLGQGPPELLEEYVLQIAFDAGR